MCARNCELNFCFSKILVTRLFLFGFVIAVRSNVFLCDETCPCSPLSFEKGSIVLCCKVLQSVNWQLFGGA